MITICLICGCSKTIITYNGKIRSGTPGNYTDNNVLMYKCEICNVIWHKNINIYNSAVFYESDIYRKNMGEMVTLSEFNRQHDWEILDKLNYTGTAVYRNKFFMDIGCGGGGLADYIRGVANSVILVEPNKKFAEQLRARNYETFAYVNDAVAKYENSIELITSYDVIEHVEAPQMFLSSVYKLLSPGGKAFIGTPTEYPVLRGLLGAEFDSFLFSSQHPWVFSRKALEIMSQNCGFSSFEVKFYQKFGIGNLIAWLQTRKPNGEASYNFITPSFNNLYRSEMASEETAEYLVLELIK